MNLALHSFNACEHRVGEIGGLENKFDLEKKQTYI